MMGLKRHHCSKSHILATDQPVAVLRALNQILQCTQGCEWYPWKPLDWKHPEGFLYLWGLQYVHTLLDVCRKQNYPNLATTSKPNHTDRFFVSHVVVNYLENGKVGLLWYLSFAWSSVQIYRHLPP